MTKMTTEEAFVKVLQMNGINQAFGIIGSAFMPISDLFPKAGITFWDVAHECNGGYICDGYTRSSGKIAMCIAQNGPGITNFVTAIKTAYWNHTPMLLVTPQAANKTIGQGGFQEVEQMALFKDMVCYQEEVRDPSRIAEVLNRVIEKSIRGSSSSLSILDNSCNHLDFVSAMVFFLACLSVFPALGSNLSKISLTVVLASALIPRVIFLERPNLSGLIST